jgi:dienelactone hydrolase
MGLFEFMSPPSSDTRDVSFTSPTAGYPVRLTASVSGHVVAWATAQRQSGVSAVPTPVALRPSDGGLYGEMHPAAGTGRHPAVLIFGGSEGGMINEAAATVLAAHGYPTLDLAYFGEPGLPPSLANIPLEYFAKALTFLRSQPGVDPEHITVKGGSRGGEAALLIGAVYPALVNAVVAGSPSSHVNMGYPDANKPAWTLHGAAAAAGDIAVERIRGPILLACGGQDAVWSSCDYITNITDRLTSHDFRYPVTVLRYPQAGHDVASMSAYDSVTAAALTRFGGSLTADQTALADAHAHLLTFLADQR